MPVSKNFKIETRHNTIEVSNVDMNKVDVVVTEKADELNDYQSNVTATLRLRSYEVEEVMEVLSHFKA